MNRPPPIRWAKAVGWSVGLGWLLALPSQSAAQGVHPPMITTPPPGTAPTAGETAIGAEPALPPTGAAIEPTTEVKPAMLPVIQGCPPRELPAPQTPPLPGTAPEAKPKDVLPDAGYIP